MKVSLPQVRKDTFTADKYPVTYVTIGIYNISLKERDVKEKKNP